MCRGEKKNIFTRFNMKLYRLQLKAPKFKYFLVSWSVSKTGLKTSFENVGFAQ